LPPLLPPPPLLLLLLPSSIGAGTWAAGDSAADMPSCPKIEELIVCVYVMRKMSGALLPAVSID